MSGLAIVQWSSSSISSRPSPLVSLPKLGDALISLRMTSQMFLFVEGEASERSMRPPLTNTAERSSGLSFTGELKASQFAILNAMMIVLSVFDTTSNPRFLAVSLKSSSMSNASVKGTLLTVPLFPVGPEYVPSR